MDWANELAVEIIDRANPGFAIGAPDYANRFRVKIAAALRAEREACARMAENYVPLGSDPRIAAACEELAVMIRAKTGE